MPAAPVPAAPTPPPPATDHVSAIRFLPGHVFVRRVIGAGKDYEAQKDLGWIFLGLGFIGFIGL